MGRLLLRAEGRLPALTGHHRKIAIHSLVGIAVNHLKGLIFGYGPFPADGALQGIGGGDNAVFRPELFYPNVALLLTIGRYGKVHAQKHTGGKMLIPEADGLTDADALGQAAMLFHGMDGFRNQALSRSLFPLCLACANRNFLLCFQEGFVKTVEIVNLSVDVDPVNPAVIHQGIKFFLGEIGNVRADHGQCIRPGKGILAGQAQHDFALGNQAAAQRLGKPFVLKAQINQTDGLCKVAVHLVLQNILREADIEVAERFVDVHHNILTVQS